MVIESAQDLVTLFSGHVVHVSNELHSSCPVCGKYARDRASRLPNGTPVAGEDRLVWRFDEEDLSKLSGFYCRGCQRAQRGANKNGGYSVAGFLSEVGWDISPAFWDKLSIDFSDIPGGGGGGSRSGRPKTNQSSVKIKFSTKRVDKAYWREKTGWSDEVIEAARCGRSQRGVKDRTLYHTIPIPLYDIEENSTRTIFTYRHPTDKSKKLQDTGSQQNCIAHIRVNEDDWCVVAEGEVDAITTAYALGWNTVVSLGSTKWQKPYAQYLRSIGYSRVVVLGDNDEAGRSLATQIGDDLIVSGFIVQSLSWPEDMPEAYDVSDYHRDHDTESLRAFVLDNMQDMKLDKEIVDTSANDALVADVEILRGNGPGSIREAVRRFLHDEDMDVLVLKVGAGIGKTHSLISHLEAILGEKVELMEKTLESLHKRHRELVLQRTTVSDEGAEALEQEINKAARKITVFSRNVAAVFTPYRDTVNAYKKIIQQPDAWYHYEGRSADNCEQYPVIQILGAKGHTQMDYCQSHCPVRELCERNGFLAQRTQAREYYLLTARHEHFTSDFLTYTPAELLVIDESPLDSIDGRITRFTEDDVSPFNDALDFDSSPEIPAADVRTLLEAIRSVIRDSRRLVPRGSSDPADWSAAFIPENGLYGKQIYDRIDAEMERLTNGRLKLRALLTEEFSEYIKTEVQPNYQEGDNLDNLRLRCLPDLIDVIREELSDTTPRSSNVALVDGAMYVNTGRPFDFIKGRKVIVMDATANETMYRLAFPEKNIEIFERYAKNEKAKTYQLVGHDFSTLSTNRSTAVRGLGETRYVGGTEINTDNLFDEALEQVPAYRFIRDVVLSLANEHKSLLVLARKAVVDHIEDYVRRQLKEQFGDTYREDKIAFVYYGSDKGRGSNDFEDYEAVVAFGRFRLRYGDVYRKAMVWSRLSGAETIIPATMIQKERILSANGTSEMITYRTFADPIGDAMVRQIEDAEVRQTIARIRPHSSQTNKTIYAFTSAEAMPFVDEVYNYRDFAKKHLGIGKAADKLREYKEWLFTRFVTEGLTKHPTYRETYEMILGGKKNQPLVASLRKATDPYLEELALQQ